MLERRELHGYRDGADWKFKIEDVDRVAKQRAADAGVPSGDEGDVLLSEHELGHSDAGDVGYRHRHGIGQKIVGRKRHPVGR